MSRFVIVPAKQVAAGTLASLLEEYASRDGTDYGDRELSLAEKVRQLKQRLEDGDLTIVFDPSTEQVDLLSREALEALEL
jgi:uncharacterized protein YheU (UPF0270 family)